MLQRNMNSRKNVHSFRPISRDTRQISERYLVCENPPSCFVFAQMTVGLGECYNRIRNEDGNKKSNLLENEISEEVFSPSAGSILAGRYKVIAKVGEGQSSILIKAEDIFHPKKCRVAIKILHASYRNLGPQEASCLLHLKKADTLKVANIAHVLNIFIIGQHFCIVFEYLLPTPLYKHFQVYPFASKTDKINLIRRIAFQVTQCLAVLSSLNIIHADIKPENILFTNGDNNDVKIIDFGNAIYWVHDEMSLYFGSFELQTVFYRAPEVMFGLPFGPEIDMWSLGCVLAELYLGEPLFFATSKDEMLEKMNSMLGPFPMTPFQSGKYFSTFKKFVGRVSTVPGCSKNVVNILKKLGSTDYIFADFLARLLTLDPSLRLSPVEAARHPFLAPECALGFLLPPGYFTQESTYSSMLLTPATYPHRPNIDDKIKKLHYSPLDLLHVGTKANTIDRADNVVKVLPFNYQEDSQSVGNKGESVAGNELNRDARESPSTGGNNSSDRFENVETAVLHSVSNEMSGNKLPIVQDRRDNAFSESCSVLPTTKNNRSSPSSSKNGHRHKSYSALNRGTRSLAECMKRASEDNAFDESYRIMTKEKHSILSAVNEDQKHKYDESYSVDNTFKDTCLSVGSSKGGRRDVLESCTLPKTTLDASRLLYKDRRDNAFNESCSVINKFKATSHFSKLKSRKEMGDNKKRPRKFVLRRRKYNDHKSESSSSISTDDNSEDIADKRTPYIASKKSPVKLHNDDVVLSADIARSSSTTFRSNTKDFAETLTCDTPQDTEVDDHKQESNREASSAESKGIGDYSCTGQMQDHEYIVSGKCDTKENEHTTPSSSSSYFGSIGNSSSVFKCNIVDKNNDIKQHFKLKKSHTEFDDEDMSNFFTVNYKETTLREKETLSCEISNKDDVKHKTVVFSGNDTTNCDNEAGDFSSARRTARIPDVMSRNSTCKNMGGDDKDTNAKAINKSTNRFDKIIKEDMSQSNSNERVDLHKGNVSSRANNADSSKKSCHEETNSNITPVRRTTHLRKEKPQTSTTRKENAKPFAEDGVNSSGKESILVASCVEQAKKSNVSSIEKKTAPGTPRNSQLKESVFDSPSSAITANGELLPGGLSDVKRALCQSEMKQGNTNTLHEIGIIQAPSVENIKKSSNEKKNSEIFEGAENSCERSTNTLPRKRSGKTVRKNTRHINDIQACESNHWQISTSFPVDILTQDEVKQPRKRKLSYNTTGSSRKKHSMSCLNSLRGRQAAKIQRSENERDDRPKDDGSKENAKQCAEVQNSPPPNANDVSQRPAVDATRAESHLKRTSRASSIQNRTVCGNEENLFNRNGSSYSKKDPRVKSGNETNKQHATKEKSYQSGIASLFDDCSPEDDKLTVLDQNELSDDESYEDYEVLLL